MRTAVPCDIGLLQESITEAESKTTFANLGLLWAKATEFYNSKKSAKQPPITTSVAMLRAQSQNLVFKTIAGKRGRGAGSSSSSTPAVGIGTKSGMNVLCPLSDWVETEVTKGPYIGQMAKRRWVIIGDLYNWGLMSEKPDGGFAEATGYGYWPSFTMVLPNLTRVGIDTKNAIAVITKKFTEVTGKPFKYDPNATLEKIGLSIDNTFQVSHCRHEGVFKRVFRTEPMTVAIEEKETEDEE